MKSLKNIAKATVFISIIALSAGCASVTDAGLDSAQPVQHEQSVQAVHNDARNSVKPDDTPFGNGEEETIIVDRPKL